MRKGSNHQNCGSEVGCYESVALNTEHTKVASHSLKPPDSCQDWLSSQTLPFAHTIRVRAGEVCDTGESELEGKAWKTKYIIQL